MNRPITIVVLCGLAASSALAVQVSTASGDSRKTQCWDVYNLRGTTLNSTIAPAGPSTTDCTSAVDCFYGYRASDGKPTKWVVPHGLEPEIACSPNDHTSVAPATSAALTTRKAPTTTAAPTTTLIGGVLSTSVVANPGPVAPSGTVSLSATVRSDVDRSMLVDLEAHSSTGEKVFQFWWDNQPFAAGQTRPLSTNWTLPSSPAAGTYTLKAGVFAAGWSSLVAWTHSAGTITAGLSATATTTSTTTTPPASASSDRFVTLPVGSSLPSGAECEARVRPAPEIRPKNAPANANRGSRANANTRTDWPQMNRVDGDFAGTTDEIIQWVACKWGINEDAVRAQVVRESWWNQSANGDNGESWGLGQVRVPYHGTAFDFDLTAKNSSAYNLDYTYGHWRACYEGVYTWLNTVARNGTYKAGDLWGCMGVWFSGRWNLGNDDYLNKVGEGVRWHYNNKTWLATNFVNG